MGVMTDQEFTDFVVRANDEYQSARANYGEISDSLLTAIGSARSSSDPAETMQDIANAVSAAAAALACAGPVGVIVGGIVAGLTQFFSYLMGAYPAAPDYNNRDASLRVAELLGFSGPKAQLAMARAGWVAINYSPTSFLGADGYPLGHNRDIAACVLSPVRSVGAPTMPTQAHEVAYRRADALIAAGAFRSGTYTSRVSRGATYRFVAWRPKELPAADRAALRLYVPLALELLTVDERPPLPEWWPKDGGMQFSLLGALGWGWHDAPWQDVPPGAPFTARALADALVGTIGPQFMLASESRPIQRGAAPGADASPTLVLAALAAVKFLL